MVLNSYFSPCILIFIPILILILILMPLPSPSVETLVGVSQTCGFPSIWSDFYFPTCLLTHFVGFVQ